MLIDRADACRERILCAHIIAEYLAMPGLSLTLLQACRVWNLDRPECADALNTLVTTRFLRKNDNTYVRSDVGMMTTSRVQPT